MSTDLIVKETETFLPCDKIRSCCKRSLEFYLFFSVLFFFLFCSAQTLNRVHQQYCLFLVRPIFHPLPSAFSPLIRTLCLTAVCCYQIISLRFQGSVTVLRGGQNECHGGS